MLLIPTTLQILYHTTSTLETPFALLIARLDNLSEQAIQTHASLAQFNVLAALFRRLIAALAISVLSDTTSTVSLTVASLSALQDTTQTLQLDSVRSVLVAALFAKPEASIIVSNVSKITALASTIINKFIWSLVLLTA